MGQTTLEGRLGLRVSVAAGFELSGLSPPTERPLPSVSTSGAGAAALGGVLVGCLWVGVGGRGDLPELEAGKEAKGRESEGLHLGLWGVLGWWVVEGLSGT